MLRGIIVQIGAAAAVRQTIACDNLRYNILHEHNIIHYTADPHYYYLLFVSAASVKITEKINGRSGDKLHSFISLSFSLSLCCLVRKAILFSKNPSHVL